MGNTQIKQNMKCFDCNNVSFVTISPSGSSKFDPTITMTCKNQSQTHLHTISLQEYFDHRHQFRGQKIKCHNCSQYEKEMYACSECQEAKNKKNPIIYCLKCKERHQSIFPTHSVISIGLLNIQCPIHRKNFFAYDLNKEENVCEDCIKNEENKEKEKKNENENEEEDIKINVNNDGESKKNLVMFDEIKKDFSEERIEELLEIVKIQMGKINTYKAMELTSNETEKKEFKEYLQNKMYFVELEWLIVGEIVNTPTNYQVICNLNELLKNEFCTLKNFNDLFNDIDPIGKKMKEIIEKKNQEKKVLFTPIPINPTP